MIPKVDAHRPHQEAPVVAGGKVGRDLTPEEKGQAIKKGNQAMLEGALKVANGEENIESLLLTNYTSIYVLMRKLRVRENELKQNLEDIQKVQKELESLNTQLEECRKQLVDADHNLARILELEGELKSKEEKLENLMKLFNEISGVDYVYVENLKKRFEKYRDKTIAFYRGVVNKNNKKLILFNKQIKSILEGRGCSSSSSSSSGSLSGRLSVYVKGCVYRNHIFFTESEKKQVIKGIQRTIDAIESMSTFVKGALGVGLSLQCDDCPENADFDGSVGQTLKNIIKEIKTNNYLEKSKLAHTIDCIQHVHSIQKETLESFCSIVKNPLDNIQYKEFFSLGAWEFSLIKK